MRNLLYAWDEVEDIPVLGLGTNALVRLVPRWMSPQRNRFEKNRRVGQRAPINGSTISPSTSAICQETFRKGNVLGDVLILGRPSEWWTCFQFSLSCDSRNFQGSILRDTRGARILGLLLERPGREIHVLDLMSDGASEPEAAIDRGDAGEVLDADARRAYPTRLTDLRGELEEAQAWNDRGRLEILAREKDQLERALAEAVGLGGRSRRTNAAAEKSATPPRGCPLGEPHHDLVAACMRSGLDLDFAVHDVPEGGGNRHATKHAHVAATRVPDRAPATTGRPFGYVRPRRGRLR